VFLMKSKGCERPLYEDIGVYPSECSSFECSCTNESKLDFSKTLSKKYENVRRIMEDNAPADLIKFSTKMMNTLERKRFHGGQIKDIAQTKKFSAKVISIIFVVNLNIT